ncbi:diguanylate cyclase domain-containing protein [Paenibacillus chartarius]|uniref:Diguanylate cyclase domain-containing protein n=1 Tax=Paenibacillus chartarius TaxID=747481 RepID=A0ABV6DRZ3_9BACL
MDSLVIQALDKANIGMMVVDKDLRIVLWNHWLERFSGRRREEVLGESLTEVCPRFQVSTYLDILQKVLYHGQSRFCSSTLHKAFILPKDVEEEMIYKQNMHITPIYQGDFSYALIQISDMTNTYYRVNKLKNLIKEMEMEVNEIKTSEKISRHLSLHDSLTGLPNRLAFHDRLVWAISYAQRNGDKLAVMFLDVDGFKAVNDTFGHAAGDRVLIEAAHRLRDSIRSVDTVARIGGDEFVVVATQLTNQEDAASVAQKIITSFEPPFEVDGASVGLTVSIGISLYPRDGLEPSELLNKADQAMYGIKAKGKNAFGFIH